MVDVLTKEQRSYNMLMIKGRNTQPEVRLRKMLYASGRRGYRLNYSLTGKPDIVFRKRKIAVFIEISVLRDADNYITILSKSNIRHEGWLYSYQRP